MVIYGQTLVLLLYSSFSPAPNVGFHRLPSGSIYLPGVEISALTWSPVCCTGVSAPSPGAPLSLLLHWPGCLQSCFSHFFPHFTVWHLVQSSIPFPRGTSTWFLAQVCPAAVQEPGWSCPCSAHTTPASPAANPAAPHCQPLTADTQCSRVSAVLQGTERVLIKKWRIVLCLWCLSIKIQRTSDFIVSYCIPGTS